MLKFFLTISVALIEDIITVCESCHMLGLESDVFTAPCFKKAGGQHYSFGGFVYFFFFYVVIRMKKKSIYLDLSSDGSWIKKLKLYPEIWEDSYHSYLSVFTSSN